MKRLLAIIFVALGLFYVAWPAYSARAIKVALDEQDAQTLSERIDFPAVRSSMRPAITAKVESALDAAAASKTGAGAAKIYAALKTQMLPKIVTAALDGLVTPQALIKVNAERGTIRQILDRLVAEQLSLGGGLNGVSAAWNALTANDGQPDTGGKSADVDKLLGRLLGKTPPSEAAAPAKSAGSESSSPRHGLGFRNVKGFGFDSPTGVFLRLAKDPASTEPDLTAHMSFVSGGWILTGLEPRL